MRSCRHEEHEKMPVFYWAGDAGSPVKSVSSKPVNYNEIKNEFSAGKLWEDVDFPPHAESLGKLDGDTAAGPTGMAAAGDQIFWVRTPEICKSNGLDRPHFVVVQDADQDKSPFSESDLKQGKLGDCWYIAALQALLTRPQYLEQVIPADNYNGFADDEYCGAFHFRLHDMETAKWVDLVVDDQLPCTKDSDGRYTPAFAKFTVKFSGATAAEFWPSLVEKAFAKFVGSYARIEGGFTSQALCNFTGGFGQLFNLRPPRADKYEFFMSRIDSCFGADGFVGLGTFEVAAACRNGCLQGYTRYCKVKDGDGKWTGEYTSCGYKKNAESGEPEEDKEGKGLGLVGPHAYTAIGAKNLRSRDGTKSYFLLQIRNPHAAHEWAGKFGDGDDCSWASVEEDLRGKNHQIEDGVFWMQLDDVIEYFDAIEFCYPRGPPKADKLTTLRSAWPESLETTFINIQEGVTSEWALFPSFKFRLNSRGDDPPAKCAVAISLVLNNYHALLDPALHFSFVVFKCPPGYSDGDLDKTALAELYTTGTTPVIVSPVALEGRDVSFASELDSGVYVLVAALQTAPAKGRCSALPPEFMGKPVAFTVRLWTETLTEIKEI